MDETTLRSAELRKLRICRFCLKSTEQLQSVDNESLSLKIATSLALEVSERDELPATVCSRCLWMVDKFYAFKEQCDRAEFLLKSFVMTGISLLHVLEPMELGCVCLPKKVDVVDVGVQVEPPQVVEPGAVKLRMEDEGWNLAEDHEIDQVAKELYGEETVDIVQSASFSDVEEICNYRVNADGSIDIDDIQLKQTLSAFATKSTESIPDKIVTDSENESKDSQPVQEQAASPFEDRASDVDELSEQIEKQLLEMHGIQTDDSVDRQIEKQLLEMHGTPTNKPVEKTSESEFQLVECIDLTDDAEHYSVESSTAAKGASNSFSDAMLLLMEDDKLYQPVSHQKHNMSLRKRQSNPENLLQTTLDTLYDDIPTTPLRESDGLEKRFVEREDGEILSDDEFESLALSSEMEQIRLSDRKYPTEQPPPANPEEEFPCEICDTFYPQAHLLECHKRAYHSNSPQKPQTNRIAATGLNGQPLQSVEPTVNVSTPTSGSRKLGLTIGTPMQQCVKCGQPVPIATYWNHIKMHRSHEGQQVECE